MASVEEAVAAHDYGEQWQYPPQVFARDDEGSDAEFWAAPRFVHYVDVAARHSLKLHYGETLQEYADAEDDGIAVLDVMASWASHYPDMHYALAAGVGLQLEELQRNGLLDEHHVVDVNAAPKLNLPTAAFHLVTLAFSMDLVTQPLGLFSEMLRVLKPGGTCIVAFSNKVIPAKSTALWKASSSAEQAVVVADCFHWAQGDGCSFSDIVAYDLSPSPDGSTDYLYVVQARKVEGERPARAASGGAGAGAGAGTE